MPSTLNPGKSLIANGTAVRVCTFCRLCLFNRQPKALKRFGITEKPRNSHGFRMKGTMMVRV